LGSGFWYLPSSDIGNPLLLYPFIGFSFGNERVYFGTRIYYYNFSYSNSSKKRIISETFMGSLILGATLGKGSFKFAPEINFTIPLSPIRVEDIVQPAQGFAFTYGFGFIYIPKK